MSDARIYVIIVTWNGMKWIDRCLSCLRKSTIPVKTIVVDNGSTDSTIDFIKTNYPEVDLHAMNENLGFGQANNFGIRIALNNQCDFVYLLNQDAYVYPDMFEQLLKTYELAKKELNIGILSPLHLSSDTKHFDRQFKAYLREKTPDIVEDILLSKLKQYYEVVGVPAAGWLLPKSTFDNIGGFDPIFFHYGEDVQYYQRVNFHGFKSIIVPTAKMIHDREDFGNSEVAKKNKLFRELKTYIFLDINLKTNQIIKKVTKTYFIFVLESIKRLLHGDISMSIEYHSALLKNIINSPKYSKNRKINKVRCSNWL